MWKLVEGVVDVRVVVVDDLVRRGDGRGFGENVVEVLWDDKVFVYEELREGIVRVVVLDEDVVGRGILLVEDVE